MMMLIMMVHHLWTEFKSGVLLRSHEIIKGGGDGDDVDGTCREAAGPQ